MFEREKITLAIGDRIRLTKNVKHREQKFLNNEVLRAQGFVRANTLQQFELNSELQQAVKGQVLWVDEAGSLSVRPMLELQEFAIEHNCRLVVTGEMVDKACELALGAACAFFPL